MMGLGYQIPQVDFVRIATCAKVDLGYVCGRTLAMLRYAIEVDLLSAASTCSNRSVASVSVRPCHPIGMYCRRLECG